MARQRVMPNAENCSLSELEIAVKAARSRRSHARMIASRALLWGQPFEAVAAIFSVSRRTLARWVARFNEAGIEGVPPENSYTLKNQDLE